MSSAFIVGYTGETGQVLVKELTDRKRFDRLVLIGRKPATPDLPNGVEVKVVDFDKLDEYKSDFVGFDQGFCCLGSARKGKEVFRKVDGDYPIKVAELAKEGGCRHFHLISSIGAGKSINFYSNVKYMAEQAVTETGFDRVSIYRPGLLLVDRAEKRPFERFAQIVSKPIAAAFPRAFTTPVDTLVKGMIGRSMMDSQENPPKDVSVLNIGKIFDWANDLK